MRSQLSNPSCLAAAGPSGKIIELRALLEAKHPSLSRKGRFCLPTGLPQVDEALEGGLRHGAMAEVVCPAGGGLLLMALLRSVCQQQGLMALIDGADSFDPAGVPANMLARLLWVRCRSAADAIQCADLLLRDGNLPLIVLDLRSNAVEETRRIPSTSWYRLQRVVEPAATAFVILASQPLSSAARPRLTLHTHFSLSAFDHRQADLLPQLHVSFARGATPQPVSSFG